MTTIEILMLISSMLGGLALFLSGMGTMSDSLAAMTGGSLNRLIGKVTKNRFLAFLFGAIMTALVQSASATTVLTVGLVNSGMIAFSKAIGLIIGANLGTTATAWILSLNAIGGQSLLMTIIKPSFFSPFLAIVGVVLTMFCRSRKKKDIGSALLGFSVMMIGMNLMSQAVAPLREIPAITDLLVSFSNPFLGFLFACAFAMLVQSSDAVIGIVQAFALSVGITYGMAIPLICGAQVGTCITSLISSLGTSNNGKRTALLNLYYNLLKTIPFLLIFYLLNHFIGFSFLDQSVGGIGIPVCHTLINLFGTVIWLPLSNFIVNLARKSIPLSEKELQEQANTLTILDENLLATPAFAIEQADRAVVLLSQTVGEAFATASAVRQDHTLVSQVDILCERSRRYEEQIEAYLARISSELGEKDRTTVSLLSKGNAAFGRMGKTVERILKLGKETLDYKDQITEEDRLDITTLGEAIYETLQVTFKGFSDRTPALSLKIRYCAEETMELGEAVKRRFIRRLHEDGRARIGSTLYTEICYVEEQLIDDCDKVADALLRYGKQIDKSGLPKDATEEQQREQVREFFREKYEKLEKGPDLTE